MKNKNKRSGNAFTGCQLTKDITDIHIKSYDVEASIIYPKQEMTPELLSFVTGLLNKVNQQDKNTQDFQIAYEGVGFRGTSMSVSFGTLYTLRKTSILEQLKDFKTYKPLSKALVSDSFNEGGIVMMTGMPGNGKTTTCVNTIISRLQRYGGICYTVEDPPEIPFEGEYGEGICFQTDARDLGGIGPSVKNLLRAYPAKQKSMVFIGEIRDAESAEQALMAAVDGRLVFTTMHAGSLLKAVDRFVNLAASRMGRKSALSICSNALKICVNQRINNNALEQNFFKVTQVISALIADDKINQIVSDIDRQKINHSRQKD